MSGIYQPKIKCKVRVHIFTNIKNTGRWKRNKNSVISLQKFSFFVYAFLFRKSSMFCRSIPLRRCETKLFGGEELLYLSASAVKFTACITSANMFDLSDKSTSLRKKQEKVVQNYKYNWTF